MKTPDLTKWEPLEQPAADSPQNLPLPTVSPAIPSATPEIFSGDIGRSHSPLGGGKNRRISRRKVSPFNIMLMLIGAAIAIVLYIGNIIAVNELLAEINSLQMQHQRILVDQEMLRVQVNRMASLERIQQIAETELGLRSLREPPEWLPVDHEKAREIDESLKERRTP